MNPNRVFSSGVSAHADALTVFRTFAEHVLRPLLRFADSWDRFEWRARGSGHSHARFWIPTTPPLDQETEESRVRFAQYWGLVFDFSTFAQMRARMPRTRERRSAGNLR
jgi:hypothetical protein